MIRTLLLLLGSLVANGRAGRGEPWAAPSEPVPEGAWHTGPAGPAGSLGGAGSGDPEGAGQAGQWSGAGGGPARGQVAGQAPDWHGPARERRGGRRRTAAGRRRRVARWVAWGGAGLVLAAIFRRAVAWLALSALSAALHFAGLSIHLPTISSPWPWQAISKGVSANTDVGPWVLQKIQGISAPALGQATFTFIFTHKVSKDIGPLPCWYASTFYAVGRASATVDLNPGPRWWAPGTGHYRLSVLRRPRGGRPGDVDIALVLPQPRLPASASGVTIDNMASKPIATNHSWTYSGLLCGSMLRPQFPQSVLYAQAQRIAFYKATHSPQITRALVAAAEAQATRMMRDNFIQPTVNALGYTLGRFSVSWG